MSRIIKIYHSDTKKEPTKIVDIEKIKIENNCLIVKTIWGKKIGFPLAKIDKWVES